MDNEVLVDNEQQTALVEHNPARPLTEKELWPPLHVGKSEVACGISAWSLGCAFGMLIMVALCVVHT